MKEELAWLTRHPIPEGPIRSAWIRRLGGLTVPQFEPVSILESAVHELRTGLKALLGIAIRQGRRSAGHGLSLEVAGASTPESFVLSALPQGVRLVAPDARGLLYGVFRLLELIALETDPEGLSVDEVPHRSLRMLDHWDNLDGSIERGYAGRSFFFASGKVLPVGPRLRAYARLCASVGINALAMNNVNVHEAETWLITDRHLSRLAQVAVVLRAWGIRLFLSVSFASPMTLGDLTTADPLDPKVIAWWNHRARLVWSQIPDFGGFVVKADSEGQPGPFSYGRDHADGANLLARAVAPFGGRILWRAFVYNCRQDWRDRSLDRARAAYDHFTPLDGRFLPNVCLQIKNGPMDFQPREPVSPLFGAMPSTCQVLELQVTQEYLGQQRHLCFLPQQWKLYLDFSLTGPQDGRLAQLVDGIVGVANVGNDENWTGHELAQANWYGFGRLAWNPDQSAESLAHEWTHLTYTNAQVRQTVESLLLDSWQTYEDYTAPLGLGWFVNPSHHYGPNPEGYEYDRWGTYHFADREGLGVDRTTRGSGYAEQYRPEVAAQYRCLETCPDELVLFFHHLPYRHILHSGKTVIQHIYDSHFAGAQRAAEFVEFWKALAGLLPETTFQRVLERFEHQKEHAALWRDVINTYFWRKSGIADDHGRAIFD